jgi:hypothetical protein
LKLATLEALEEVAEASAQFQESLAKIGAETIVEALSLWRRMNPADIEAAAAEWLDDAVQMILSRRSHARELGLAYYRLARALITGSTVPDPRRPEPTYVTLEDLRREFAELAGSSSPSGGGNVSVPIEPHDVAVSPRDDEGTIERDDEGVDLVDMTTDELREALRADIERTEAERREDDIAAEEEARLVMEALGKEGLIRRVRGLDDEAPASEVDAAREEAKRKSGNRQAAAAERVVLNGARGEMWRGMDRDKRALGWARQSRTGTPCGFCAMLISRGAVYRTEESATFGEGDLYHDNCKCYAVPVWTKDQYADSMFDMNRTYSEWWPEVTRRTSGKQAQGLWRKFFRLMQENGWSEAEALAKWNAWLDTRQGNAFEEALIKRIS